MKRVYIYKGFERFWHWMQAFLVIFLAITGFEVHGSFSFFGFEQAVKLHIIAAYSLIILIIFAIFWHFATGEWRQYIPTLENINKQIRYYITGIFQNAPHPVRKTSLSKLNPLQRLTYLGLKIVLFPLMISTGILYLFYRFPQSDAGIKITIDNLGIIAYLHTLGAFLLIAFVIAHLYLITTGQTLISNLKAMITGYEELEEEENEEFKSNIEVENETAK
jgi:thiosulfate reductase cytochrome b subunit